MQNDDGSGGERWKNFQIGFYSEQIGSSVVVFTVVTRVI